MKDKANGQVYIIGAGPGDPEYLTLKAYKRIKEAEVVLYDDLIDDRILDLVPPKAERIYVGRRHGSKTNQSLRHELIQNTFANHLSKGKVIVRLKSGDPLIFSRTAEEIECLLDLEIPFEIIPGISAGFAAATILKLPLTKRMKARALIISLGHTSDENMRHITDICPLISNGNPLMLYMARIKLQNIIDIMIQNQVPSSTKVFACANVSLFNEVYIEGDMTNIVKKIEKVEPGIPFVFIFCKEL